MPEIVEVRKFADIIKYNLIGSKITAINILKGRYTKKTFDGCGLLSESLPAVFEDVKTKGKFTYITLKCCSGKTLYLFNTLGLTGGWTVRAAKKTDFNLDVPNTRYLNADDGSGVYAYPVVWEYISHNNMSEWFEKALDHLNVEFVIDKPGREGMKLYFYDQLSFGTLKVIETRTELDKKLKELGPDLMDDSMTFDIFKKQVCKGTNKNKAIGNVIVNQKLISGVGNYLRADALYMSAISPFRKVSEIEDNELESLFWNVRALVWGDYDYKEGQKKGYFKHGRIVIKVPRDYDMDFFVYRKDKDLEGKTVVKEELYEGSQKRFIYWVKDVQK